MPSIDDLMKEAHDIIDDGCTPIEPKPTDWGFGEINIELEGISEERFRKEFEGIWVDNKCLHRTCSECNGSGTKKDGSPCMHYISCPCKQCTPWC